MNTDLATIMQLLKEQESILKERFKARIIGIFGSRARDEHREASDLDVLVAFDDDASLLDFVALAEYLESVLGVKVDLVTERALRPEIRSEVLKDLVVV